MCDLGGRYLFGYTLAAFEADPLSGDCLKASEIVQSIALWIPKNGIDIEKIVPQELFDGVRLGGLGHIGVIFHAPEIEQYAIRTNVALCSAEGIRRKIGVP